MFLLLYPQGNKNNTGKGNTFSFSNHLVIRNVSSAFLKTRLRKQTKGNLEGADA
jgi:hypothetical protein